MKKLISINKFTHEYLKNKKLYNKVLDKNYLSYFLKL